MTLTFPQKGITSGWTGTDRIRGQSALQTTDAATHTLATFTVGTTNDPILVANVNIGCMLSTGASAAYGTSQAAAFYNGATTAAVGTLPTITLTTTAAFAVVASWSVSGNNLLLQVTGIVADTINWVCSYEYFAVTTSTS